MKLTLKICTSLVLMSFLASCGAQKPMVSDINVTPSHIDNDFYIELSATLRLGKVKLPSITLPIVLRSGSEVGSVNMAASGGLNYLSFKLNITAASSLSSLYARLPNGSFIPLIANNKTIEIPIARSIKVYASISTKQMALGLAIPFKSLDPLGRSVGTTSLFPSFNIKGVIGSAGIFTSRRAGGNGFALVADVTSLISQDTFKSLNAPRADLRLDYSSKTPSAKQESKINTQMYKMHKKQTRLKLR